MVGPQLPGIARVPMAPGLKATLLAVAMALAWPCAQAKAEEVERVLSLGGAVTEIIYALGEGDRVVARDTTSTFPAEARDLPDVGYVRSLSPEGVLSVAPDLIVATDGSGPAEAIEVLQAAEIPLVTVPEGYDAAAIRLKIETIAEALGVPEQGATLADRVEADLTDAIEAARMDTPPRVLFILSLQGGRIMAAGAGTGAQGIIELAGGVNAMQGFEGYRQVSEEAVLLAAPDVILMMEGAGDHAADRRDVLDHPALGQTPAARADAIVRQPGLLLLGFGPRTPEAVRALSGAFQAARG